LAILAGIDEAGLGPVLGPLVVSATAFEIPDEALETSLWSLLSSCVSRKAPKRSYRLHVADSKKVFNRAKGDQALEPMERAILCLLHQVNGSVDSLGQLLGHVCPGAGESLGQYPWYRDELPLPLSTTPMKMKLSANALAAAMKRCDLKLSRLLCEPLPAGHYNRLVGATRNKSAAAFSLVSKLIAAIVEAAGDQERIVIWIDRQGGRMRYQPSLEQLWPGARLKILAETDRSSSYRLQWQGRCLELVFQVQAEDHQLPVALASMASKYVRELFMHQLNGYWCSRIPELAPTAGYFSDGRRFFEEIRPHVGRMGIDEALLYRIR
jgi:hypothetical protein